MTANAVIEQGPKFIYNKGMIKEGDIDLQVEAKREPGNNLKQNPSNLLNATNIQKALEGVYDHPFAARFITSGHVFNKNLTHEEFKNSPENVGNNQYVPFNLIDPMVEQVLGIGDGVMNNIGKNGVIITKALLEKLGKNVGDTVWIKFGLTQLSTAIIDKYKFENGQKKYVEITENNDKKYVELTENNNKKKPDDDEYWKSMGRQPLKVDFIF